MKKILLVLFLFVFGGCTSLLGDDYVIAEGDAGQTQQALSQHTRLVTRVEHARSPLTAGGGAFGPWLSTACSSPGVCFTWQNQDWQNAMDMSRTLAYPDGSTFVRVKNDGGVNAGVAIRWQGMPPCSVITAIDSVVITIVGTAYDSSKTVRLWAVRPLSLQQAFPVFAAFPADIPPGTTPVYPVPATAISLSYPNPFTSSGIWDKDQDLGCSVGGGNGGPILGWQVAPASDRWFDVYGMTVEVNWH